MDVVAVLTSGLEFIQTAKRTGNVNTRLLPAPAVSVAPMAVKLVPPVVPASVPQAAVPVAAHNAVPVKVTPDGRLSVTLKLLALDGPLLVTVIV